MSTHAPEPSDRGETHEGTSSDNSTDSHNNSASERATDQLFDRIRSYATSHQTPKRIEAAPTVLSERELKDMNDIAYEVKMSSCLDPHAHSSGGHSKNLHPLDQPLILKSGKRIDPELIDEEEEEVLSAQREHGARKTLPLLPEETEEREKRSETEIVEERTLPSIPPSTGRTLPSLPATSHSRSASREHSRGPSHHASRDPSAHVTAQHSHISSHAPTPPSHATATAAGSSGNDMASRIASKVASTVASRKASRAASRASMHPSSRASIIASRIASQIRSVVPQVLEEPEEGKGSIDRHDAESASSGSPSLPKVEEVEEAAILPQIPISRHRSRLPSRVGSRVTSKSRTSSKVSKSASKAASKAASEKKEHKSWMLILPKMLRGQTPEEKAESEAKKREDEQKALEKAAGDIPAAVYESFIEGAKSHHMSRDSDSDSSDSESDSDVSKSSTSSSSSDSDEEDGDGDKSSKKKSKEGAAKLSGGDVWYAVKAVMWAFVKALSVLWNLNLYVNIQRKDKSPVRLHIPTMILLLAGLQGLRVALENSLSETTTTESIPYVAPKLDDAKISADPLALSESVTQSIPIETPTGSIPQIQQPIQQPIQIPPQAGMQPIQFLQPNGQLQGQPGHQFMFAPPLMARPWFQPTNPVAPVPPDSADPNAKETNTKSGADSPTNEPAVPPPGAVTKTVVTKSVPPSYLVNVVAVASVCGYLLMKMTQDLEKAADDEKAADEEKDKEKEKVIEDGSAGSSTSSSSSDEDVDGEKTKKMLQHLLKEEKEKKDPARIIPHVPSRHVSSHVVEPRPIFDWDAVNANRSAVDPPFLSDSSLSDSDTDTEFSGSDSDTGSGPESSLSSSETTTASKPSKKRKPRRKGSPSPSFRARSQESGSGSDDDGFGKTKGERHHHHHHRRVVVRREQGGDIKDASKQEAHQHQHRHRHHRKRVRHQVFTFGGSQETTPTSASETDYSDTKPKLSKPVLTEEEKLAIEAAKLKVKEMSSSIEARSRLASKLRDVMEPLMPPEKEKEKNAEARESKESREVRIQKMLEDRLLLKERMSMKDVADMKERSRKAAVAKEKKRAESDTETSDTVSSVEFRQRIKDSDSSGDFPPSLFPTSGIHRHVNLPIGPPPRLEAETLHLRDLLPGPVPRRHMSKKLPINRAIHTTKKTSVEDSVKSAAALEKMKKAGRDELLRAFNSDR